MKSFEWTISGSLLFTITCLASCGRAPAGSSESAASPKSAAAPVPEGDSAVRAEENEAPSEEQIPSHEDSGRDVPATQDKASQANEPFGVSPPISELDQAELYPRIELEQEHFDGSLQAEALSCTNAEPHVVAICHIAERLCSFQAPTSLDQTRQCKSARESCESARKRFAQSCTNE